MTILRKTAVLCALAALLAASVFSPAAWAYESRQQDTTITENNRGRGGRHHRGGGRGHRGGGRYHHGGSGWAWAGLGAAIGLGVLDAVTNDSPTYYVEPAPSYQVVVPSSSYYYYPAPTTYYGQPAYVQPNYGQTYVAPPAPCVNCP